MTAIDNTGSFQSDHEVVLQGLGQWLPYADTATVPGGRVFYGLNHFTGTEDAWNRVPVLFVPPGLPVAHPDHEAFSRDPEGTARALGYRIVGRLNNTKIEWTGTGRPQMVADAILKDSQAAQLAKDQRLGLSTGFDAMIRPDGRITGKTVPNHLLIFLKCGKAVPGRCGTANDPIASFNNLGTAEIVDEKISRHRPPSPEHGIAVPEVFREQARQREQEGRAMVRARGKIDPTTGMFRDFLPGEEGLYGLE